MTIAHVPPLLSALIAKLQPTPERGLARRESLKASLLDAIETRLGWVLKRVNISLAASALSPAFGHLLFVSEERARHLGVRVCFRCA